MPFDAGETASTENPTPVTISESESPFKPGEPKSESNPAPIKIIEGAGLFRLGEPVSDDNPLPVTIIDGSYTPTPTPTASIPAAEDLALWFRPEDLVLADGATVDSWTDSIAGVSMAQATSANQPTFRATAVGGQPVLEFDQTHWLNLGRPTALMDALNRYNDTTGVTLFFVLNVGTNPSGLGNYRTFWSPSNVNDGERSYVASENFCGGRGGQRYKSSAGFRVIVVRRSSIFSNQANLGNFFDNMGGYAGAGVSPASSGDYLLGAPGNGTAAHGFVGHIADVGCYNRALTTAEICQVVKFFHDKYGQPYPWAALDHFDIFDGDSQTYGVGTTVDGNRATNQQSWPNQLMDAKGRGYDAWNNLAIGSRTSNQMTAAVAGQYTGLQAELGIPIIVHAFEFYNQPDSDATGMKAWLAAVRAAAPEIRIVVGTSIDNSKSDSRYTNRAAFNAALEASTDYDIFVPLHTDTTIGVEGACPDDPGPYGTYFSDGIHCLNAGYTVLKDFWSPYYDDAVALL